MEIPCEQCPVKIMCYEREPLKCPLLLKWFKSPSYLSQGEKKMLMAEIMDCDEVEFAMGELFRWSVPSLEENDD